MLSCVIAYNAYAARQNILSTAQQKIPAINKLNSLESKISELSLQQREWILFHKSNSYHTVIELLHAIDPQFTHYFTKQQKQQIGVDLDALRKKIQQYRMLQWRIADLANTEQNEYYNVIHQKSLQPVYSSILKQLPNLDYKDKYKLFAELIQYDTLIHNSLLTEQQANNQQLVAAAEQIKALSQAIPETTLANRDIKPLISKYMTIAALLHQHDKALYNVAKHRLDTNETPILRDIDRQLSSLKDTAKTLLQESVNRSLDHNAATLWTAISFTLLFTFISIMFYIAYKKNLQTPLQTLNDSILLFAETNKHTRIVDESNVKEIHSLIQSFTRLTSTVSNKTSELKRSQDELSHLASHDQLTGLLRYNMFENHLMHCMHTIDKRTQIVVYANISIENLSDINRIWGESVTNKLLHAFAKHVANAQGQKLTACRKWGSDFAFFFVMNNAEQIERTLKETSDYIISLSTITITQKQLLKVIIGYSLYPSTANDMQSLISSARQAMNDASDNNKTYSIASTQTTERISRTHRIDKNMLGALKEQQFYVVYQPQYDLTKNKIIGAEALARWHNKSLGFVSPEQFINSAERMGLIQQLDKNLLEMASRDIQQLHLPVAKPFKLAFNASMLELISKDYPRTVFKILETHNIHPSNFVLEVTETIAMQMQDQLISNLDSLRKQGIRIALDDFGTGYSSLSRLSELPIDIVKIDKSFIDKIDTDKSASNFIKEMISIIHSQGFEIVAEGVEREAQLKILEAEKCEVIQGYLISKPLEFNDFEKFLHNPPRQ